MKWTMFAATGIGNKMDKPKLYIENAIFAKINYFVQNNTHEVGGMGLVSYNKDGNYFYIREAFLLDQEVTGVTTDLDASAVGKLELEVMGRDGDLNYWWHSHVNMSVFWSGTDLDTIKKYGKNGYMLATVFNKKKEMRSAIAYKASSSFGDSLVFIDELETIIYDSRIDELELEKENKLKVRQKTFNNNFFGYNAEKDYSNYLINGDKKSVLTQNLNHKLEKLRKAIGKKKINVHEIGAIENLSLKYAEEGYSRAVSLEAAICGVTPELIIETQDHLTQNDLQEMNELYDDYYQLAEYGAYYGQ